MLSPGTTIDRYVIQDVLGEGGMAIVYRVRHGTLGTIHALKVLTSGSSTLRERTIQEGKLQAHVRHPNIVAVTDVLDARGMPGLLMEYVAGPSLEQLLAKTSLSLDEALGIFGGILDGVAYAHQNGLVHRDLKPGNVLLAVENGLIVPKVTDFGLAKSRGEGGMRKTRTGTTMGTPAYMSPEQIRDASSVDHRADIYSLGCLFYELVCGVPPYDGADLMEIFSQIASGSYIPPEKLNPQIPTALCDAIKEALQPDPRRRTADCATFRSRLGALTQGRALSVAAGAGAMVADLSEQRRSTPSYPTQSPTPTWSDSLVEPPASSTPKSGPSKHSYRPWRLGLALAVPALGALALSVFVAVVGIGWAMKSSMSEATGEPLAQTPLTPKELPPPVDPTQVPLSPEKRLDPKQQPIPVAHPPSAENIPDELIPIKAEKRPPEQAPPPDPPPEEPARTGSFSVETASIDASVVRQGKSYSAGEPIPVGVAEIWVGDRKYGHVTIRAGENAIISCDLKYRQACGQK